MDGIGWQGGLFLWLIMLAPIPIIGLTIAAIIYMVKNKKFSGTKKVLLAIVILALNLMGVAVYFLT